MPPSPRSLLFLHGLSLLASLVLTSLCAYDFGTLSIWCNPIFGLITLAYHLSILLLTCTRPLSLPSVSKTCNAFAYFLSFCWFAAFFAMIIVYETQADGSDRLEIYGMQVTFPPQSQDLQRFQFLLVPVEWILLCDLGIRTTLYRPEVLEDAAQTERMKPWSPNSASPQSSARPRRTCTIDDLATI